MLTQSIRATPPFESFKHILKNTTEFDSQNVATAPNAQLNWLKDAKKHTWVFRTARSCLEACRKCTPQPTKWKVTPPVGLLPSQTQLRQASSWACNDVYTLWQIEHKATVFGQEVLLRRPHPLTARPRNLSEWIFGAFAWAKASFPMTLIDSEPERLSYCRSTSRKTDNMLHDEHE